MAKTLANLITHARVYLDEVSEADWTDTQITVELNYAYMEMYAAVIDTYEDYYKTVVEADTVNGQQEYALPTDFYKMKRLEVKYASTDERRKAEPFDFMQFRNQIDSTQYGSQTKPLYEIAGSNIRLMPIPDSSVSNGLYMVYIKQLTELSDNADTIDIPFPDRYGRYIVLGACAQLLRKGQQEESVAIQYGNEFLIGQDKMKQELEDRYLDGVKRIIDTQQDWSDFGNVPPFGSIGSA